MNYGETEDQRETGIATGNGLDEFVSVTYCFQKYEIIMKLTTDGKFVGIEEVRINKDFRTFKQQTPQEIFKHIEELPSE
jgi:hypothetical protein